MKFIYCYSFCVRSDEGFCSDFHVDVKEYATFYSVSLTKFGSLHPCLSDFRVKKKLFDGPYAAFEHAYKYYSNHYEC